MLKDARIADICKRVRVVASPELDKIYPEKRPTQVTVHTKTGTFKRFAEEALGSSVLPLDDAGLEAKFMGLVFPVLGKEAARRLVTQLWSIASAEDLTPVIECMALPQSTKMAG